MNSVSKLKSPQQAAWYHDKQDDYYAQEKEERATSAWRGRLSAQIGNVGSVDRDVCAEALAGRTPNGDYLGRWGRDSDGNVEWQHTPGWDSTFSADKSFSIMALVGSDDRLIKGHDEAVDRALKLVESRIGARIKKSDGSVIYENTGAMAAAVYRHETSRNQDAQLHSHALIQNITQTQDGQWRSIDSRVIYEALREASDEYQQHIGRVARECGYTTESVTTEKGFTFVRIKEAPEALVDLHSSRRKDIKQALKKAGLDENASRRQRQTATLNTRKTKAETDHGKLKAAWKQQAIDGGHDLDSIIENAKKKAAQKTESQREAEEQTANEKAVEFAVEHLAERDSRFTNHDLLKTAKHYAIGTSADPDGIEQVINEKQSNGELFSRQKRGYDPEQREVTDMQGWTTADGIRAEKAFLSVERQGRNAVDPILSREDAKAAVDAASSASEFGFNKGQREAAEGLLSTNNRITALQGYAGTAKTSSVVATYTATAEAHGHRVRGMAPTNRATEELASAGIDRTENTARLLARIQGQPDDIKQGEVWLVDEASMLSANDMRSLTRAAENHDARVVLVGDVQQLGSIQAGEAYQQLQRSGMETHTLDTILRQRNDASREAVESSIDRDFNHALDAIDRSGRVNEHRPDANSDDAQAARADANRERLDAMANEYLSLDKDDREKTLVIDPSRDGRAALNDRIRDGLKDEGSIDRDEMTITALEKKDMTQAEAKDYRSYDAGDVVRFNADRKRDGIEAGREYEVTGRDDEKEKVELRDRETGEEASFSPYRASPRKMQVYEESELNIAAGDRIRFNQNDKEQGRTNGQKATVESIDREAGTATINTSGKTETLDTSTAADRAIRHDYAQTAHAAQGQTADRVIAHADTDRQNLLDQRSFYVEISRAKESISIYTDDRERLQNELAERSGEKDTALEAEPEREAAAEQERGSEPEQGRTKTESEKRLDAAAEDMGQKMAKMEKEEQAEQSYDVAAENENDQTPENTADEQQPENVNTNERQPYIPESSFDKPKKQQENEQERDHDQGLDFSL